MRVRRNKREPQKQKVTAGGNIGVAAGATQKKWSKWELRRRKFGPAAMAYII